MIIKKLLKFSILDYCIESFINAIDRNFSKIYGNKTPRIGDFYSKIITRDKTLINCTIKNIGINHYEIECQKYYFNSNPNQTYKGSKFIGHLKSWNRFQIEK